MNQAEKLKLEKEYRATLEKIFFHCTNMTKYIKKANAIEKKLKRC